MDEILITIMMTVYNDVSLLPMSIESVRRQQVDNWELLILDNSENSIEVWNMLEEYEKKDSRIHVFKSPGCESGKNVGWAKGSSILLEKAKGKYVFFLAADDMIDADAFAIVRDEIKKATPDIIWVGNLYVTYNDARFEAVDAVIPDYKILEGIDKVKEVDWILKNTYYNSMFHYCKVTFLKQHRINFFDPYYADCGSMTAALCYAEKMVVIDKPLYYLTINTSQTSGKAILGSYAMFSQQWKLIRDLYKDYGCIDKDMYEYAAERIFNNLKSHMGLVCDDAPCRDLYMNDIIVNKKDRIRYIKTIVEDDDIEEMIRFSGNEDYFNNIKIVLEKELSANE